ncbi:MAG: hypothetical protein Q7U38_16335, partial [Methylobacter sp.]|nr:hypothetical protein [Methylobacter sp.]
MYHDSVFSVSRRFSLWLIVLMTVLYAPGVWAIKYAFQVPKYTHSLGADNVPENTYQAYLDTDKQLSGWFETAEPLAADLTNLNILELVESTEDEPGNANAIVAYEFQDGEFIYTYYAPNSSTPDTPDLRTNSGLISASISTDQYGKLAKAELGIVTSLPFLSETEFSGNINAIYVTSSGVLDFNITNFIMGVVGVTSLPAGVDVGSDEIPGNINAFAARTHAVCVENEGCTFTNKGAAYVAGNDGQINADVLVVTVPVTVPDAPTALQATAGNAQATLAWTLPLNDGGAVISN